MRSRACSARFWRCVRMPVWSTRRWSPSTAPRSTPTRQSARPADYEQLAREGLADADAIDAEEDERFGDCRGDELPEPLGTREGRARWLADAKRHLEQRRAHAARPIPASRPARLREAKRRLDEEHRVEVQANAEYEAYRARGVDKNGRKLGRPPKPFTAPAQPT